jgi:hypothetical protein
MNYGAILLIVIAFIFGIMTVIGFMSTTIMPNNTKSYKNNNILIYLCILTFILVLLFWAIFNVDTTIKKDLKNNNVTIKEVKSDMNILKSSTGYIYHNDDNRNIIYAVNRKDDKVITINNNYKYIQYVLVDNEKDIHVEKCILSSDNIKPITFDCYRMYLTKDLMNDFINL